MLLYWHNAFQVHHWCCPRWVLRHTLINGDTQLVFMDEWTSDSLCHEDAKYILQGKNTGSCMEILNTTCGVIESRIVVNCVFQTEILLLLCCMICFQVVSLWYCKSTKRRQSSSIIQDFLLQLTSIPILIQQQKDAKCLYLTRKLCQRRTSVLLVRKTFIVSKLFALCIVKLDCFL